jgi:hypothetical protein
MAINTNLDVPSAPPIYPEERENTFPYGATGSAPPQEIIDENDNAASIASNAIGAVAIASTFAKSALATANANPLRMALYVILAVVMACTIAYYVIMANKKQDEIKSTLLLVDPKIKSLDSGNINIANANVDIMTMPLRNFYIKTALNCCCLGEWKNNYVDMAPLIHAIKQGYRCLDFEIYSEGNAPVVAASMKNNYYNKETYNSLPLSDVISTIISNAFSSSLSVTPNGNDPLLINLRIKSNNPNVDFANGIVKAINQFGDRLLGPEYNYLYDGNNLGQQPMSVFMDKVIIMADVSNPMCTTYKPLYQIINAGVNSPFLHKLQYDLGVKNTPDMQTLIDHNKKNMSIVFPDAPFKENINFNVAKAFGCQMIGMMPQLNDINLQLYNKAFNSAGGAFILKPPNLCYKQVVLELPPPQDPALSFAGRNYSTDYASWRV